MKLLKVKKKDWSQFTQGDWSDKDWIEILKTINKKANEINAKYKDVGRVNYIVNGKILSAEVSFDNSFGGNSFRAVKNIAKNLSGMIDAIQKGAIQLEDKFGFTFKEQI